MRPRSPKSQRSPASEPQLSITVPFAKGRAAELKDALCRMSIAGVKAIRAVDPEARMVHVDPITYEVPEPGHPELERKAWEDSFEKAFEEVVPNENTYIIIVTRGHQEDQNVLRWAVQTNARYIGMIGSKRKIRSIAEQLESEGIPRERLERVYMPIGLDIGAVLPEEIAVAIVAEVIHVRRAGFKHPLSKKLFQTTHT